MGTDVGPCYSRPVQSFTQHHDNRSFKGQSWDGSDGSYSRRKSREILRENGFRQGIIRRVGTP